MSKLIPPAPQNLRKRTQFFLDNPEYPGAREELKKLALRAGEIALKEYHGQGKKKTLTLQECMEKWHKVFTKKL